MKVYLSNYRNHWISPYTILEKVFYWRKDYDAYAQVPPKWLESMCKCWKSFLDFIHPRIEYVKIDPYDTWNMDHTLSIIILAMLKQLRTHHHGSSITDNEDVPDELKVDDIYDNEIIDERWLYVLDEMIFAFEHILNDDWEDQAVREDGVFKSFNFGKFAEIDDRINNGLRLFGKYYRSLWD